MLKYSEWIEVMKYTRRRESLYTQHSLAYSIPVLLKCAVLSPTYVLPIVTSYSNTS